MGIFNAAYYTRNTLMKAFYFYLERLSRLCAFNILVTCIAFIGSLYMPLHISILE